MAKGGNGRGVGEFIKVNNCFERFPTMKARRKRLKAPPPHPNFPSIPQRASANQQIFFLTRIEKMMLKNITSGMVELESQTDETRLTESESGVEEERAFATGYYPPH